MHRHIRVLLVSIVLTATAATAQRQTASPAEGRAQSGTRLAESYGKLPLSFEANQGQTDREVKFLSRGKGYTLFLTANEAVLTLQSRQSSVVNRELPPTTGYGAETRDEIFSAPILTPHSPIPSLQSPDPSRESHVPAVLRMQLVGAFPSAKVVGLEELPGKSNYFIGRDPKKWRTNVPTYAKVRYNNVYPGVDLVYYGNQRELEHDFIVAPGADPSPIIMGFEGAKKLSLDLQGDLVLAINNGEIRIQKPVVYQVVDGVRGQIPGSYVIKDKHQVGFQISAYNVSKPLVIDPVLSYSTYLGGSGVDYGASIAVDMAGNAFVTGGTNSIDFPTTNPSQAANAGSSDAFVAKLNPAGSALVYCTYLGGGGGDGGSGIALDSAGNAYVVGTTGSTDYPTTTGSFQNTLGGATNAFVTKLNAVGSGLVYSTYLGGSTTIFGTATSDAGASIAVDSAGNAYVTGSTGSNNFPTTPGAFQATHFVYRTAAFVTKMNPTGSGLSYSTYLSGFSGATDQGSGIVVDSSGNAYVTGFAGNPDFPTTAGAFQTSVSGLGHAFVAKLDPFGSGLVYSTFLAGSCNDRGNGIALDSSGNAYVIGTTCSADFPVTASTVQTAFGGNFDVFVTKLNPAGSGLLYSTYLGGSGIDDGHGIAVDGAGNAYITGGSGNFPTVDALQASNAGGNDAFVAKLNAAGSALVYSTDLGGNDVDYGYSVALDTAGNPYVTGLTYSTNFPTANPLQAASAGNGDAFIAKITEDSTPPTISCGSVDGIWHASDVIIACTAQDSGSGLAKASDANFTLSTSVAAGTETANASTDTYQVCDKANNCATAGPIAGNKVDKKAPTVSISTPTATTYLLNQSVLAQYQCTDAGSGVASCSGTVANGAAINTSTVGSKTFSVSATDNVGSGSNKSAGYSVTYAGGGTCFGDAGHQILQPINADGTSVWKQGRTIPAKFRVCDANGVSVGTAGAVRSFFLTQIISGTVTAVDETVSSTTPDTAFRWDATNQQWIFNISTTSLAANNTYVYTITLNDGTTIVFQYGLK